MEEEKKASTKKLIAVLIILVSVFLIYKVTKHEDATETIKEANI